MKLSDQPNEDFTIGFVKQEHFGFLIGKGGFKRQKLERDFRIQIIVNNNLGTFTVRGPSENKKNGIIEIKYVE